MILPLVLVIHIILAFAVCLGFAYRYILAFKNKEYPVAGRKSVFTGAVALIITGSLLAIIGKLPVTSLCLDSLGIVVALLVMEVGLQKLSSRLAEEKARSGR